VCSGKFERARAFVSISSHFEKTAARRFSRRRDAALLNFEKPRRGGFSVLL
jgi:hypothetical protein